MIRKFRDKHVFQGVQLEEGNHDEVVAFLKARKAMVCAGPAPCLYAPEKWMVAWRNKGEETDCSAMEGEFVFEAGRRCISVGEEYLFKYFEEVGRGVKTIKEVSANA